MEGLGDSGGAGWPDGVWDCCGLSAGAGGGMSWAGCGVRGSSVTTGPAATGKDRDWWWGARVPSACSWAPWAAAELPIRAPCRTDGWPPMITEGRPGNWLNVDRNWPPGEPAALVIPSSAWLRGKLMFCGSDAQMVGCCPMDSDCISCWERGFPAFRGMALAFRGMALAFRGMVLAFKVIALLLRAAAAAAMGNPSRAAG